MTKKYDSERPANHRRTALFKRYPVICQRLAEFTGEPMKWKVPDEKTLKELYWMTRRFMWALYGDPNIRFRKRMKDLTLEVYYQEKSAESKVLAIPHMKLASQGRQTPLEHPFEGYSGFCEGVDSGSDQEDAQNALLGVSSGP